MTNLTEELQAIKEDAARLEKQRAKKEADIDILKDRIKESAAVLKDEYGVTTVAEAKALLEEKEAALRADIDKLKKAIEEAS